MGAHSKPELFSGRLVQASRDPRKIIRLGVLQRCHSWPPGPTSSISWNSTFSEKTWWLVYVFGHCHFRKSSGRQGQLVSVLLLRIIDVSVYPRELPEWGEPRTRVVLGEKLGSHHGQGGRICCTGRQAWCYSWLVHLHTAKRKLIVGDIIIIIIINGTNRTRLSSKLIQER